MSNSQDQSLDEDTVFLAVNESCPQFLHCERERYAIERLMSAGPGVFYTCLGTEHLGCFLSPSEVNQISSWTQEYHISQLQVEKPAVGGSTELQDFSDSYFPTHSDTPAPSLKLGWPERFSWTGRGNVTVHTSPPAEGQPPIREIIRRHLQDASQVIAIVTDRLTDGAVIGDLHNAASRGVPVYIILNQRSIQENFTNGFRHPNMQVRVLGGNTFISRGGQMAVGEMKDNFLLVDLETVIHGSYSLTWTDAHLHRQLITVLSGPVVGSFDREFRILFAASFPIPDIWNVVSPPVDVSHQLNELSDLHKPKQPPRVESPPPPPPVDSPLDWEFLGVMQRYSDLPDSLNHQDEEIAMERTSTSEKPTPTTNEFTYSKKRFQEDRREYDDTNNVRDRLSSFNKELPTDQSSLKNTNIEMHQRVGHKIEQAYYRQKTDADEKTKLKPVENKMESNSRNNKKKECSMSHHFLEEINLGESFSAESPSSRKPLILRVPQRENFSSLSDIMRRLQPQQSSSGLQRRGPRTAASDMTRSMMDLSVQKNDSYQDERREPVPRFNANYFDPGRLTSGIALMKKRNDQIKLGLYRPANPFVPSTRPRSTSFGLHMDWRRPWTKTEGEHSQQE